MHLGEKDDMSVKAAGAYSQNPLIGKIILRKQKINRRTRHQIRYKQDKSQNIRDDRKYLQESILSVA